LALLEFEIKHFPLSFQQKRLFFSFEWLKCNFTTFSPPGKILLDIPGINPSDAHENSEVYYDNLHNASCIFSKQGTYFQGSVFIVFNETTHFDFSLLATLVSFTWKQELQTSGISTRTKPMIRGVVLKKRCVNGVPTPNKKTEPNSSNKVSIRQQGFPHWILLFHCVHF